VYGFVCESVLLHSLYTHVPLSLTHTHTHMRPSSHEEGYICEREREREGYICVGLYRAHMYTGNAATHSLLMKSCLSRSSVVSLCVQLRVRVRVCVRVRVRVRVRVNFAVHMRVHVCVYILVTTCVCVYILVTTCISMDRYLNVLTNLLDRLYKRALFLEGSFEPQFRERASRCHIMPVE